MDSQNISIVVPVYDEEGSVEALRQEIREIADEHQWHVEIVFVDDGSHDAGWSKIVAMAGSDPAVGGIRFQTNAGKAAALMAGFAAARGDIVFMMDAYSSQSPFVLN